ncbi:glycosyltransferase [Flavobacterium sp.]|uniref:glycosyltransferase family protein n=1 Tax=Flavobacterium sp. TaxID=239 RepID=UPI00262C4F69|nr:glycosyltransferase [Flavobacterium sp.]
MNILLVGEYSRLHNSLKEGLLQQGHQVKIAGFNDGFKNFPVDVRITKRWDSGIAKKIKVLLFKLTGFDLTSHLTFRQFYQNRDLFSGYDVVQLINENSFQCGYAYERKILDYIFKNNKKVFLLSCGTDYANVNYYFDHPDTKSVVQPYRDGKIGNRQFQSVLKFRTNEFQQLHQFLYTRISGVIASDLDYHLPLVGNPRYLGIIPNPVNTDKLKSEPLPGIEKVVIFLGINKDNYYQKGCDFFEKALKIISEKYADKTEIIVTKSIPYDEYIKAYNSAHILLDQCYAIDQGYNALEAMARGKVVFTGAGPAFLDYYGLDGVVVVDALPDVRYLVSELSYLIENQEAIKAIGKRAAAFVAKEHHYLEIAGKYVQAWQS